METLNISEKKNRIKWDYDTEADVLYISFGNPKTSSGGTLNLGARLKREVKKC